MSLVAVFHIGSLGDTVVSVPALRSIRALLPKCSEYLLVSGFQTNLKVSPSHIFDMVWPAKHKLSYRAMGPLFYRVSSVAALIAQLRFHKPKYCVYLMPTQRSQEQVDRDKLFFRAAGVRELIGFRTLAEDEVASRISTGIEGTESYLRFRRLWGAQASEKFAQYGSSPLLRPRDFAQAAVITWLKSARRFPERRLVAFCPFSNDRARDIHPETIVQIVTSLENEFGAEVVMLGGRKDRADAEAIIAQAKGGLNACGVFQAEESGALLLQCVLAVCTESGPMHLAGGVGVPTVVVFSRVNQWLHEWLPLGSDHTILYQEVPCAGCQLTVCPIQAHPCMQAITAGQILAAVDARLTRTPISPASLDGTRVLHWPQ